VPYTAQRIPQLSRVRLRGLEFQTYRWPGLDHAPVLLLHGWGDTGATWQFVVDHSPRERTYFALDLRGFGRSERPQDGYWFPDYLADVDALIDEVSPHAPIDLVGHSMGGNIALLYAGVRPTRVRRVVSLEGLGLTRTAPEQAPARYAEWLDQVRRGVEFTVYDSFEQLISVLARRNPRTPPDRLEFIARSWAREREDGRVELLADPKHKRTNPVLYQRDQAEACWRAITAPVLIVKGQESDILKRLAGEIDDARLREIFRAVTSVDVPGAGHMLHHERPEEVARIIEEFLR